MWLRGGWWKECAPGWQFLAVLTLFNNYFMSTVDRLAREPSNSNLLLSFFRDGMACIWASWMGLASERVVLR